MTKPEKQTVVVDASSILKTNLPEYARSFGTLGNTIQEATETIYLPYIYIEQVNPVNKYKAILVDGSAKSLEAPYILYPLLIRSMYRKLENKRYTERVYDTVSVNPGASYHDFQKLNAMETNQIKDWKQGFSQLVVVITEGQAKVVIIESPGASSTYWFGCWKVCQFDRVTGVKITDISHEKNTKKGAHGTFLDFWKFKGFEAVTLSEKEQALVVEATKIQKNQINSYLEK